MTTTPTTSAAPEPGLAGRGFLALAASQLLGAFVDNLFKSAMSVTILYALARADGAALVTVAGALFVLPYVVLSGLAGQLSDRFDRARLLRAVKASELAVMALGAAALSWQSVPLMLGVLFAFGAQSTLTGPLKYATIPDLVGQRRLPDANALVEGGTFLAILLGTVLGGLLATRPDGALLVSAVGLAAAAAGLAAALLMPSMAPVVPGLRIDLNLPRQTLAMVRATAANRRVFRAILALSWFWTLGAVYLAQIPAFARDVLGGDGNVVTLLLAVFSVGVGAGSVLGARAIRGRVTAVPVPVAGVGLTLASLDLVASAHGAPGGALVGVGAFLADPASWRTLADLFAAAVCGGAFSLPLFTILQSESSSEQRASAVASNNIVNALAMAVGSAAAAAALALGATVGAVVAATAAANLAVALLIAGAIRGEMLMALARLYFRLCHRIEVRGLENAARVGDRVVVAVNHLSFLDGVLVAAFIAPHLRRPPIVAIDTEQARKFAFLRHVIDLYPVDPLNPMAVKSMVKEVRDDRPLFVWPEGRITRTGGRMKIYDSPGAIADKAEADLLTVSLDGLQFHFTSRMRGILRRRAFPKVTMTVLPPRRLAAPAELRGKARRQALTLALKDAMTEAAFRPEDARRPLFAALLDARSKYARDPDGRARAVLADAMRTELGYDKLVLGAAVLGGALARRTAPGEHVGVLMPNAVSTVVAFFALHAYGRVPTMLNFSVGSESVLSACATARVRAVLTSRQFVAKAKLERLVEALAARVEVVYLEDVRAALTLADKLAGKARAMLPRLLLPGAKTDPDAPAAVLFTSGSEGAPKGVVLTHANILSNVGQVRAAVTLNPTQPFFNALPMFHSMGLTGGTVLPLMLGCRCFLYPNPLHYKIVPELVYAERSKVMFATDSFLRGYARMAKPEDLESLDFIVAGAEAVKAETRRIYWEVFQKAIYEGYGSTECSPVIAINVPGAYRIGTVGRFLPGLEHRLEPVPGVAEGGRLSVRGPNVMAGYLRAENPGVVEPPADGWYDTGDIVAVDAEGYARILGRAKRWSKIAGEAVSHAAAEGYAADLWPGAQHAVVGLPDPRKGEQIVLVTTQTGADARALLAFARERGVAEIMVPRAVVAVERLPLLGTGKTDYPAVQKIAEAWAAEQRQPA